jgi:hypothetical protein
MGRKLMYIDCGHSEADGASSVGKIVNVYDTYANARLHGASGLIASTYLYSVNRRTGNATAPIEQTVKTVGLTIDNNGIIAFGIDDTLEEVYLMSVAGRWGGPRRQAISSIGTDMESESSSSSTEAAETSSSSTNSSSNSSSSSIEFSSYSSSSDSSSSTAGMSTSSDSSSSTAGMSTSSVNSSSSTDNSSSSSSQSSSSSSSNSSSSESTQSFSSSSTSSQS